MKTFFKFNFVNFNTLKSLRSIPFGTLTRLSHMFFPFLYTCCPTVAKTPWHQCSFWHSCWCHCIKLDLQKEYVGSFDQDVVTWHSKCEADDENVVELSHHCLVQLHHILLNLLLVTSAYRMVLGNIRYKKQILNCTISRNFGYHSENLSLKEQIYHPDSSFAWTPDTTTLMKCDIRGYHLCRMWKMWRTDQQKMQF